MRASEFILETQGKLTKRQGESTRGLNLFWDPTRTDSDYTMNRVMMAAAATDGTFVPEMNDHSWFGNDRTAHPYTKEEQEIMNKAYKAAGAGHRDVNHGNMHSKELETTNKVSPIKAFKGYRR
jgi:hypothetical protein